MARVSRHRRCSRALAAHAFFVGISWFAIGLPVVLLINAMPTLNEPFVGALARAPHWLRAGILAVTAVFAFPYLWPAYMAIGGLEARCAAQMRRGASRARALAGWLLLAQAVGFVVLALALCIVARRPAFVVVPMLLAVLHLWLARWIASAGLPTR